MARLAQAVLVAAGFLGLVELVVSHGQQLLGGQLVQGGAVDDAHAGGDGNLHAVLGVGAAQAIGDLVQAHPQDILGNVANEQHELVTAEATHQVVAAQLVGEHVGGVGDGLVAHGMAQ
ncbi:MAG: hypothetical protein Q4D06_05800 [Coriobacteriia bacterium]|nr:hypothetical protein [Coriobacteriia bacterium]